MASLLFSGVLVLMAKPGRAGGVIDQAFPIRDRPITNGQRAAEGAAVARASEPRLPEAAILPWQMRAFHGTGSARRTRTRHFQDCCLRRLPHRSSVSRDADPFPAAQSDS